MTDDARAWIILALVVLAPFAIVLLVALIRGYDITLLLHRRRRGDD